MRETGRLEPPEERWLSVGGLTVNVSVLEGVDRVTEGLYHP